MDHFLDPLLRHFRDHFGITFRSTSTPRLDPVEDHFASAGGVATVVVAVVVAAVAAAVAVIVSVVVAVVVDLVAFLVIG